VIVTYPLSQQKLNQDYNEASLVCAQCSVVMVGLFQLSSHLVSIFTVRQPEQHVALILQLQWQKIIRQALSVNRTRSTIQQRFTINCSIYMTALENYWRHSCE